MPSRFLRPLVVLIIPLLVAGAFVAAEDGTPYRVGAILPLSGPMAFVGDGTLKGLTLARDFINESGGIAGQPLELMVEDSKSEAAQGVAAFRKLTAVDHVKVIYCALTSVSMAIKPIAEKSDVLVFSQSVHPSVLEGSSKFLRTFFTVPEADTRIFEWLKLRSFRRLGLIHAEEEWGEATKRDLLGRGPAEGLEIVTSFSVKRDQNDMRTDLIRLNGTKPDAVYIAAIGPVVGLIAKQMSELSLAMPRIFVAGCSQASHVGANRAYLNGYDVGPRIDAANSILVDLQRRFKERYSTGSFIPDQHLFSSYDALLMLQKVLSAAPEASAADIREALIKLPPQPSTQGPYDFDATGEISAPMGIYPISQGVCGALE